MKSNHTSSDNGCYKPSPSSLHRNRSKSDHRIIVYRWELSWERSVSWELNWVVRSHVEFQPEKPNHLAVRSKTKNFESTKKRNLTSIIVSIHIQHKIRSLCYRSKMRFENTLDRLHWPKFNCSSSTRTWCYINTWSSSKHDVETTFQCRVNLTNGSLQQLISKRLLKTLVR